ncbi:MAG: YceI family protein [Phycisphaerae bacterium]|jgi:polyisoprenoid-binding protein YceI
MKRKSVLIVAASGAMVLSVALLPGVAADNEPAKAETYKIDSVHSTTVFRIKHSNVSYFWGRFNAISGTVAYSPSAPEATAFDVTIRTDSIDTANPGRDNHLKGPDFFNAKQFPTMTFKSKSAKRTGESKVDVTGDLTIHGVTKEVTIPIVCTGSGKGRGGGALVGFETMFTINRSDYGMKYMVGPLGDDVRVVVAIEAGTGQR